MQCIIMENTLIKLALHDETKKRAHDSQIVRAKQNLKLSHKPILFEKFFASAMCIRQMYVCNQLHRYILCVVVVIVGNKHWNKAYRWS